MDKNKGRKGQSLKTMSLLTNPNSAGGNASFSSVGNLSISQMNLDIPTTPTNRRQLMKSADSNRSIRSLSIPGECPSSPRRDVLQKEGNSNRSMSMPSGAPSSAPVRGLLKTSASNRSLNAPVDPVRPSTSRRNLLAPTHSNRSIKMPGEALSKPKSRRDLLVSTDSNRSINTKALSSNSSRRNLLQSTHSKGSLGFNSPHSETRGRGILKHSGHRGLKHSGRSPTQGIKANLPSPPLNADEATTTAATVPGRREMLQKIKSTTSSLGDSVNSFS